MKHFYDWYVETSSDPRPWLILGKGPSFERRWEYDLVAYRLMGLNHAGTVLPVEVAHAIDIDVLLEYGEEISRHAGIVVLPWYPHVNNAVGTRTLAEWLAESRVLQELDAAGRLFFYDLGTVKTRIDSRPVVEAIFFSAEAALGLLARAGAHCVRSLGVDGGACYGASFSALDGTTRLANGQASFDLQFAGIAKTIFRTGVDYAPLTEESPIRIFVGAEDAQDLAVKVLEYSIRQHASMSVQIVPLNKCGIQHRLPIDPRNRPRTPFSFQRFAIPELAGRCGKAIYVDSDMIVFKDIRELWSLSFGDADLLAVGSVADAGRRPQFSVMLLDCGRLDWSLDNIINRLDAGDLDYESLMYDMKVARKISPKIGEHWNSLEKYVTGETALLHYTDMHRQPWVRRHHPLGHLWHRYLRHAVADGFITRDEVVEHVQRGWIRPSTLWQLDMRVDNVTRFPGIMTRPFLSLRDHGFIPPYRAIVGTK